MRCLVTGAGGFIGSHLAKRLHDDGHYVVGTDQKGRPDYFHPDVICSKYLPADLRSPVDCRHVMQNIDYVYHLAADMGGIGYITENHAQITTNNTRIDMNMLEAARQVRVQKFFYASSACVYPIHVQGHAQVTPLAEHMAWPANPEPGYGLEKLYAEELCRYYTRDYGLETHVARFHNVYGPRGTWKGGKEKAPAALCRKVAEAGTPGIIEIWGDGQQTRSFLHVDDCVEGIIKVMNSDARAPLNLGSERLITIEELARMIIMIAGKNISLVFDQTKPQGVRGRNSDNSSVEHFTGWRPLVSLESGLAETYNWIRQQILNF